MQLIYRVFLALSLSFLASIAHAEQQVNSSQAVAPDSPEVGKHVMANVDPSNMILSLLMVLVVIIVSALILKRFNFVQQSTKQMNIVASLSLGAKERLIVVQVGEQQMVLGVTQQQITLIDHLAKPLAKPTQNNMPLTSNIFAFLQKNGDKINRDSTHDGNANTNKK
jgi:flagellar biosynthetic protein FliO